MNLVEKSFESLVFGQPRLHLGEKLFGDVDGSGFAVLFESEVLSGMERPAFVAPAGRSATAVGVGAEGGGEDRRGGGELFEPPLEHAEDETGVAGNGHGTSRKRARKGRA